MMKRTLQFAISLSVITAMLLGTGRGQTASDPLTDKIKDQVTKLYAAPAKKVVVKLKNGAAYKGYVVEAHDTTFVVAELSAGKRTEISYSDVAKIKRSGLSQAEKTAFIAAAIGAVVVLGIVFRPKAKGGLRCLLCN